MATVGAAVLSVAVVGASAVPLAAQDFDLGRHVPGVRVALGREPYDISGATAPQIMRQLETAGRPSWAGYAASITWSYDAQPVPRFDGTPSDQCRFTEFEMVLDFSARYPRWSPPGEANPELAAAWSALQDQIDRQWSAERDDYLDRATEAVRQSRSYEDHCPLLAQRFHDVVRDLMDRSSPLSGTDPPERVGLNWPPEGFEALLETDEAPTVPGAPAEAVPDSSDEASERAPTVTVRPGMPRPVTTPAPDLEYALQTDLRGSTPTGLVAALHHQGTLQYFDAFGTHPETGEALTIDTPLPLPAFTQVLVSTLAFALHEVGLLDVDAPVSTYMENVSPAIGRSTTRQLLEHRAGLDNAPPRDSTMAWEDVLDRLDDRALATGPGSLPSYSSYSFGLAARVLERAAGTTLEDALRRTLLDPLAMQHTSFGPRDEEGVVDGLPIVRTSAADLLRFWYAWLDGSIAGVEVELLPTPSEPTLSPDGRAFGGGLWVDRPGATPRLTMLCGTDLTDALVQVFPLTGTVLLVIGLDGWPRHTSTFMLDAVGRTLRIGNEVFGPVRLAGVAGFLPRERPCSGITTSRAYRPVDFGPRAEAADWVGRYVNGDWFFALEEADGLLVSPRGGQAPWQIHHFEGDTHFASVPPEEDEGVGFPFRLFRGPDGLRYLMLGDRAYLHEADRTP